MYGAVKAADRLSHNLSSLDGNSQGLLDKTHKGGVTSLQIRHLAKIESALADAAKLAGEYPNVGNLVDVPRLCLAIDVAKAIEKHLLIRATSTKGGLYEAVLEIMLHIATGLKPKSVHSLSLRANKNRSDKLR